MVVLLTGCYVYYAAGSFTVWYVVVRGICTLGWSFTTWSSYISAGVLCYSLYALDLLYLSNMPGLQQGVCRADRAMLHTEI